MIWSVFKIISWYPINLNYALQGFLSMEDDKTMILV